MYFLVEKSYVVPCRYEYLINVTTIDKQYLLLHYQSTVYVQINDQIITFHLKCPSHYDSRFDWFECFQLEMAYTIKHR